ncbi:Palmitoyltransferase zdhhc2 [Conglomerata obtusa]
MNYDEILAEFKKKTLNIIATIMYPAFLVYNYFVIIGQFCLVDRQFGTNWVLCVFVVYHCMLIYTCVFYLRILPNDGASTKDIFHQEPRQGDKNLKNFNPYLSERIAYRGKHRNKTCSKCKVSKPPRAHHCKICNTCFLKMDHHCFAINSCIGFHNYKLFVLFLLCNCIFSAWNFTIIMIEIFTRRKVGLARYVICVITMGIDFAMCFPLFIFHCKLIMRNETTIESIYLNEYLAGSVPLQNDVFQEGVFAQNERVMATNLTNEERDRRSLNPYNLGRFNNFLEVFGDDVWQWIIPTFTSKGNGIVFKKNTKEAEEEYEQ